MRSSRSSRVRSSGGASAGRRTARGFGSNVTATGRTPSACARSTAVRITAWCPRWIPSNVPWATTLGGPSGRYWSRPRTICMEEAKGAQPVGRYLADAEEARAGVHAACGAGRRELGVVELRRRHALAVAEAAAGLRRDVHGRQVIDGPVGRQDAGSQRRRVARLDRRPRNGVLEPERSDSGPDERLDVSAASERLADVGGEAADVRTRPAPDADPEAGRRRTRSARTRRRERGGANARRRSLPAPARGDAGRPRGAPSTWAGAARCRRRTARAPPARRRP